MSSGQDKQHLIWCLGAAMNPGVFMKWWRLKALHVGYESKATGLYVDTDNQLIKALESVKERKCLNLHCGWTCVLCSPELEEGSVLLKSMLC